MKTHLPFRLSSKFFMLTFMGVLLSAFSFAQYDISLGYDGNGNYVVITKYASNGHVDSSYGINGSTDHLPIHFFKEVYLPDGKIILVGNTEDVYTAPDIHWDIRMVRVNADGTLDPTFGSNGVLTITGPPLDYDVVTSVDVVQGRIAIGTTATSIVGSYKSFSLGLWDTNGTLISYLLFQTLDYFDATANVFFVLKDYTINTFLLATGTDIFHKNLDGQPVNSFNGTSRLTLPVAQGTSAGIKSLLIYNNKIIVGATTLDSTTFIAGYSVYVFNSDGSPDISFGNQGIQIVPIDGYTTISMSITGSTLYVTNSTNTFAYPLDNTTPPVTVTCPANKVINTDAGKCTAVVNGIDPSISPAGSNLQIAYALAGATSGTGQGTASGKVFNSGITTITYSLSNDPSKTCSFTVKVQDNQAPSITFAAPEKTVLWPPDHKMVNLEISYMLTDNCGGTTANLWVTSNEPESGTGNGDLPNDWQVVDAHHVRLRAERNSNGNGRVYTIDINAFDASGYPTIKQVFVRVPHEASVKDELRVKAAPNPFNSSFKLSIESWRNGPVSIKVYDIYGRVVESKVQVPANSIVQLGANYKPGLYVVEVSQGILRQTLQVIKLPAGNSIK
ncbi:MAG: T9SS type A sorting domain-containing protein [Ferruginibacter sp.]